MKETLNMGIQIDKELIENNVSNAVCVAIASALGDKDELIGKAVKAAELNKSSVRQQLAAAFLDAVIGAAQQDWKMPVTVSFTRSENY